MPCVFQIALVSALRCQVHGRFCNLVSTDLWFGAIRRRLQTHTFERRRRKKYTDACYECFSLFLLDQMLCVFQFALVSALRCPVNGRINSCVFHRSQVRRNPTEASDTYPWTPHAKIYRCVLWMLFLVFTWSNALCFSNCFGFSLRCPVNDGITRLVFHRSLVWRNP